MTTSAMTTITRTSISTIMMIPSTTITTMATILALALAQETTTKVQETTSMTTTLALAQETTILVLDPVRSPIRLKNILLIFKGSGMNDNGSGGYDYENYDDYYYYYDDKYADFINVYRYFFWISTPLRDVILSNDAEEVFTSLAPSLMGLANAIPVETTLELMRTAMKDLKKSLEAGAIQPLVNLLSQVRELITGTEEEEAKMKDLVDGIAARLLSKDVWRKSQESLHALEEKFYAELVSLARGQGLIPSECEIDRGRGAFPFVCATSQLLWHFFDWVHMMDWDYEVGIFMGQRSMRRAKKKMKKLDEFLATEGDDLFCKVVSVSSEVSRWAVDLFFGDQIEALLPMMEHGADLSKQLLLSC